MRLATARDELLPTFDDTVKRHPPYLTVMLLSRVVTKLGDLNEDDITPTVMENLFAADLAFLQDLYRRVNSEGTTRAVVKCPSCHEEISVDVAGGRLGESCGTPLSDSTRRLLTWRTTFTGLWTRSPT